MAVSWSTTGPTPYYFYNSLLSSKNTAPIGQSAPTNWERWQSASTDNLLDQYATTTDPKVQQQAISSLEQTMVQQVPSIPLVYGANFYEYSTAHFTGWPDQNNPFAVPTPETVPDCEAVVLNLKPV
jgi:peptide/nickel transport system substrate-binding protein